MLVDTHAHLYDARFEPDRDEVVRRAAAAGVTRIVVPAVDAATLPLALALCDRYPGVSAMAALHPCYVAEAAEGDLERVAASLADPRVVAVGETGLDYYWSRDAEALQRDRLAAHVRLALDADLPLSLHTRDRGDSAACLDDTVAILRAERDRHPSGERLRGVFHCFGGPADRVDAVLELGFCVGLGGTLTYRKGGVDAAIEAVPLDRIVLETDAPYLAPTPHRGARNEPAHVRFVAERLASLRGLTVDAVAAATTRTAERLFALPVIATD